MQRIFHIDLNYAMPKREVILKILDFAAEAGYNAILWEVEDKIQWETCPECVHPDAFSKAEFIEILDYAAKLHLEPIPLLQTLGHAEYVLNHEEYAPMREMGNHDSYCISHVSVLNLLQNWIQEYVDLFGDIRDFHLGGDEAWTFGTCPECAEKVKIFGKLGYAMFHYSALADRLIRQGIRPNIWADLPLQHPDEVKRHLPLLKHFRIWDWQYATNWDSDFGTLDKLSGLGLNAIPCAAARSWADKIWVPSPVHLDNVASTAAAASKRNLSGYCVTSWMVRLVPFELQRQFIAAGPLFEGKASCSEAERKDLYRIASGLKTSGQSNDFYHAMKLAAVDFPLSMVHQMGIGWNDRKDHEMPPHGWLAESIKKQYGETGIPTDGLDAAETSLTQARTRFERLGNDAPELMGIWLDAIDLRLEQLKMVRMMAAHDPGLRDFLSGFKTASRTWFHRFLTDRSAEEVMLSLFSAVNAAVR